MGLGMGLGIGLGSRGGSAPNILDNFDLYANFIGDDAVFTDGQELAAGTNGISKGKLYIKDKSTGQIELLSNFLAGYGDNDFTDHIVYGDAVVREFGRVFRFSFLNDVDVHEFDAGLCLPDLSDCANSDALMYSPAAGSFRTNTNAAIVDTGVKTNNGEFEFCFVLGGFDVNGVPYTGSDKANYTYGYLTFVRGGLYPMWHLLGVNTKKSAASLVPFVAFKQTNTAPYKKTSIVKAMTYVLPELNISQGYIATGADNQFAVTANNFLIQTDVVIAANETINIYFAIDDYASPQNGYRLEFARVSNIIRTLYKIVDGTETAVKISTAGSYLAGSILFIKIWNSKLYISYRAAEAGMFDIAIESGFELLNKVKLVKSTASNFTKLSYFKAGFDKDFDTPLYKEEPFYVGTNPPGYALPGETRKGWFFDVSSQINNFGNKVVGVVCYLTNGSSVMVVKYRNHTDGKFISELTFNVNLRFAYSGTDAVLYIASDPHFGSATADSELIYSKIIIPDLTIIAPTHCFILGDICNDVDDYDSYIALKGLYPSATWYELNGNHDYAVRAEFLAKLGYSDFPHAHTVGNMRFIMCGHEGSTIGAIDQTFLAAELDANTDKNCIIMTHHGMYNTVTTTDTDYIFTNAAELVTLMSTRKNVAWFCGHSHGYQPFVRKLSRNKYLWLGDNT